MSGLLSDHGIDTVRFRWRDDSDVYQQFKRRPEGYQEGARGEVYVNTELGRVGVYRDGLAYLEGRGAAILAANRENHELLAPADLLSAELVAQEWVRESGVPLSGEPARLGRADLASELRFSDGGEGSAFLHSIAALDVPWSKIRVDGLKGGDIETVSLHGTSGSQIALRAYDKGVESGTDPRGQRIRVERQKRFRKALEPLSSEFLRSDLGAAYLGREFKRLAQLESAVFVDVPSSIEAIYERAETWQQAERLAGFVVLGKYLRTEMERTSYYRRQGELRSLGVFVQGAEIERLEVPVGRYFQTLGSAWAA